MDRRGFVKAGVAASVVAGLKASAEPAKKRRPNVLYVFGDQHRAASMPGEPFCEVKAPNLDAFRRSNFSMDTCISNYPVCTPYRGILMTGKYPYQTGLVGNANEGNDPGDKLTMKTTEITLTQTFKKQGYHTGYVGKWHLGGDGAFTRRARDASISTNGTPGQIPRHTMARLRGTLLRAQGPSLWVGAPCS